MRMCCARGCRASLSRLTEVGTGAGETTWHVICGTSIFVFAMGGHRQRCTCGSYITRAVAGALYVCRYVCMRCGISMHGERLCVGLVRPLSEWLEGEGGGPILGRSSSRAADIGGRMEGFWESSDGFGKVGFFLVVID